MELTSWLALAAICDGAISPGPSLALIIRNTVQGGQATGWRRRARPRPGWGSTP